jgi:ComEC/Rec2-like protein
MKIKLKVRRVSFLIFIFIFLMALTLITIDISNNVSIEKEVKNFITKIEKVEFSNNKSYIYTNNMLIKSFISDLDYKVGDIVEVNGKLQDNLSLENKSYGLYLKSKGYDYTISASKMKKIGEEENLFSYIFEIRQSISSWIDLVFPKYNGIIKALTVSDRQNISDEDKSLFSKSGLSHIISISGFHIVLVSSIFFSMFFFLPKKYRYIISAIITLFYVAITGFNPPCVRAYVFYICYIASILLQKRYDIFSVGFLLASVYMALNPYIIFNIGFCLSFMCVFSIAMFYKGIFAFLKRHSIQLGIRFTDIPKATVSAISVTVASYVLTLPYLYYNIGVISFISVLSNIISIPIISLSYPFIMLSLLFMKIPFLCTVFANIVNFLLTIFYKSNELLIRLPFAYIEIEERKLSYVLCAYVIILSAYHIHIKNKIEKNIFVAKR